MPFGGDCEYPDFDACVADNEDKDDPEAYCAVLQEETEGTCRSVSVSPQGTPRYKVVQAKTKELGEGRIHAIVSTESQDREGDIIRASGWNLDNFKAHPVLLASHNYFDLRAQIGEWESMEVSGEQLEGVARYYIDMGNEQADWGYLIASEGRAAYSVGFIPDMDEAKELSTGGADSYEFQGQELLEVSHVTIPANPQALQYAKLLLEARHMEMNNVKNHDHDHSHSHEDGEGQKYRHGHNHGHIHERGHSSTFRSVKLPALADSVRQALKEVWQ